MPKTPFQSLSAVLGPPGGHFLILQAVLSCRQCGSAPGAVRGGGGTKTRKRGLKIILDIWLVVRGCLRLIFRLEIVKTPETTSPALAVGEGGIQTE